MFEQRYQNDVQRKIADTLSELNKGGRMLDGMANLMFLQQNRDKLTLAQTLELAALEYMQSQQAAAAAANMKQMEQHSGKPEEESKRLMQPPMIKFVEDHPMSPMFNHLAIVQEEASSQY